MLNQERVQEMTRLAIFDTNEGESCKPMMQYFRNDYIAKELLKSVITGTLAFFIIAGTFLLYRAEEIFRIVNSMDIQAAIMNVALAYLIFMAGYFLVTYVVYHIRYTQGRQKVKNYYVHLKKVNRIYHQEDHS